MTVKDELFDTKLELAEQRIEARLIGIESKIDRVLDRVAEATAAANRAQVTADEARQAAVITRWNVLFFVLGGVAAIIAVIALGLQFMELATNIFTAGQTP